MLAVALLLGAVPAVTQARAVWGSQTLQDFASINGWRLPLAILLLAVGLYAAHTILPNRRLPLSDVTPGIVLTIVFLLMQEAGFSWPLRHFSSFTLTYASLSGLFAALFFFFLAALVLFFAGALNRLIILVSQGTKLSDKPSFA